MARDKRIVFEAPRKRPRQHRVLQIFRAHLRVRPAVVFAELEAHVSTAAKHSWSYTAAPSAFLVIVQGRWWYRGEYRVVPDAAGSNLEYTVISVAQRARAISRIAAQRALVSARSEFDSLARQLRLELE